MFPQFKDIFSRVICCIIVFLFYTDCSFGKDAISLNPHFLKIDSNEIAITDILLNGKQVEWSEYSSRIEKKTGFPIGANLSWNENNLTFHFIDYSIPHFPPDVTAKYKYHVKGLDDGEEGKIWHPEEPTTANIVSYTDLVPGNYVFEIRTTNKDILPFNKVAKFRFIIEPPFWSSFDFYVVLACGIFIFVMLAMGIQQARSW